MKVHAAVVALLLICCCMPVSPLLAGCVIEDEEEYAVLAAVLFPAEPDVPDRITDDLEREAYRALARPRMSGFESNSYTILNTTLWETEAPKSPDVIAGDFYEKNKQACTIDGARLRAHLPGRGHVSVVSWEEAQRNVPSPFGIRQGDEGRRRDRAAPRIVTYLSRPGFNKDRTEAVVEAHRQAHPEMGVGYRVHLKKSPKTGTWFITAARRTRVS